MHSTSAITLRNQNAAERYDTLNTAPRTLSVPLESPIDLTGDDERFFTMLVRQNTAPLLSNQLTSLNRELALEFVDAAGNNQFDVAFHGQQQQFSLRSQADSTGGDVTATGFAPNTTYLLVGRIQGNGNGANTLSVSLLPAGASIGNFAADSFDWNLTNTSSASFNPVITDVRLQSLYEGNFTVSNLWLGTAADFFSSPAAAAGDFNGDGLVSLADYSVWRDSLGTTGQMLAADANGNGAVDAGDYQVWKANFGTVLTSTLVTTARVPEPASLLIAAGACLFLATRHLRRR
jgi:hypothetical protein